MPIRQIMKRGKEFVFTLKGHVAAYNIETKELEVYGESSKSSCHQRLHFR